MNINLIKINLSISFKRTLPAIALLAAWLLAPNLGFAGSYCVQLPEFEGSGSVGLSFNYTYTIKNVKTRGFYRIGSGTWNTPGDGEEMRDHPPRVHDLNGQTICLDMSRLAEDLQRHLDASPRFQQFSEVRIYVSQVGLIGDKPEVACPRTDRLERDVLYTLTRFAKGQSWRYRCQ